VTVPVALASAGAVAEETMQAIARAIRERLGLAVHRHASLAEPTFALNVARGQLSSTHLLRLAEERCPSGARRYLLVTERDLFIPMLTFVFGQAQLGGRVAVLSVARLDQTFYGRPFDPELLHARAGKEALHELGHTLGLTHCQDQGCIMSLACTLGQIDSKHEELCQVCAGLVGGALQSWQEGDIGRGEAREKELANPGC
jgi:archaemetzincin